MGGRGSSASGSVPTDKRDFDQLPLKVLGVNSIAGYKIIIHKVKSNAYKPIESNTPNAVYITANMKGKISSAIFFKDHKIYKEIGVEGSAPSIHYWKDGFRKSHDKKNTFPVEDKSDRDLAAKMIRHNRKYFYNETKPRKRKKK